MSCICFYVSVFVRDLLLSRAWMSLLCLVLLRLDNVLYCLLLLKDFCVIGLLSYFFISYFLGLDPTKLTSVWRTIGACQSGILLPSGCHCLLPSQKRTSTKISKVQ